MFVLQNPFSFFESPKPKIVQSCAFATFTHDLYVQDPFTKEEEEEEKEEGEEGAEPLLKRLATKPPQSSFMTAEPAVSPRKTGRIWVPQTMTSTVKQVDKRHNDALPDIVKKDRTCVCAFRFRKHSKQVRTRKCEHLLVARSK